MYSSLENIQILVTLLKKYNVRHIVISAGTRHTPLVYSIEQDSFFETYSIVDERSAAFFAIGMIEKLRRPVAVVCTSGTAAANYVSAANEAFYQCLPLLLLTADRNGMYKFQQEEQMIPQENLYRDVCKSVVTLGHVRDKKDFWYFSRLCNEALLELTQGEPGPVHINFIVENNYPIYQGIVKFECDKLPEVKKITRLTLESSKELWRKFADKLQQNKILIIYGQRGPLTKMEFNTIENFARYCNCMISVDLLSNYRGEYTLPTFAMCRMLNHSELENLCPDIVITINANTISEIKSKLLPFANKFEHWHVSAKGKVSDPFKCLSDVVACSPNTFFKKMYWLFKKEDVLHSYYDEWYKYYNRIGKNGSLNNVDIQYSALYVTQQLLKRIPEKSVFHIANSNSIRLANYFDLVSNIEVYGNRGTHGIDGSMSAFLGQANLTESLCFLLIGDLSFFYDMNSLWTQYIKNNIRIIVVNNSGGAIFHSYPNTSNIPTLDEHIAAEHHTSIKAWVEYRGFKYLSAYTKDEVKNAMTTMCLTNSIGPFVLEAFTDKDTDAESIKKIMAPYIENDDNLSIRIAKYTYKKIKVARKKFKNRKSIGRQG